ncbi:MAG: hypothetical protein QW551_05930 [Desulfurococcaceae archaeon]
MQGNKNWMGENNGKRTLWTSFTLYLLYLIGLYSSVVATSWLSVFHGLVHVSRGAKCNTNLQ